MSNINQQRRQALHWSSVFGLAIAAGLLDVGTARANWDKSAFEAKDKDAVLKALGGHAMSHSAAIEIQAPDIAENGASVQVSVRTKLPNVEQIAILVAKNPNTLAANFTFSSNVEPGITTRVKMNQSSAVYALVKSEGNWFVAEKEVKVTLGGCGG